MMRRFICRLSLGAGQPAPLRCICSRTVVGAQPAKADALSRLSTTDHGADLTEDKGGGQARSDADSLPARGGRTNAAQRESVKRALEAGLELGVSSYHVLVNQLQVEGRLTEVSEVLEQMSTAGVEPDERMQAALDRAPAELSRMRTAALKAKLDADKADGWSLFDGLLRRGQADDHQLSAMLAHGGLSSSTEKRKQMERARAAGLEPGVFSYTVLLSQLQMEGRTDEVKATLSEMRAAGIQSDSHARSAKRKQRPPQRNQHRPNKLYA